MESLAACLGVRRPAFASGMTGEQTKLTAEVKGESACRDFLPKRRWL